MAAFQEKASEASSEEPKASGEVSAREIAMRNLGRKGVVTSAPGKGVAGALKNLGIEETSQKVVPNWKMTAAQKNAAAARAEIKGSGGASSARSVFSSREADTITSPSPSFRAAGLAAGLAAPVSSASRPSTVKSTAAPTVVSGACASAAAGAAEAADMVDHDLNLLVAGLKRLGTTEADGSVVAPFGKIVDDEILEQQLESLVGTLKAGCGAASWTGRGRCSSKAFTTRNRSSSSHPQVERQPHPALLPRPAIAWRPMLPWRLSSPKRRWTPRRRLRCRYRIRPRPPRIRRPQR